MKYIVYAKSWVFLLALMLTGAGGVAFGQEEPAVKYEQEHLMLVDQDGDRVLSQLFWATCETGIKKCLLFDNVPPQDSQLRSPRFSEENPILDIHAQRITDNTSTYPTFDVNDTFLKLRQIILSESRKGVLASFGEEHTWAESSKWKLSKIITALATASSARFLYVGHEEKLIEWIKNQADNSVKVEDLFYQSYRLNEGNVYLTILTIENVLSDATFEAERENTLVNQKLVDLYKASPNKFGDWYHFFGTMLAGYVGEPAHLIVKLYSIYRKISRGSDAEKATLAADKAGADIGVRLRKFMKQGPSFMQEKLIADLKKANQEPSVRLPDKMHLNPADKLYVAPNY